ncbi:MAG: hypothetical protein JWQ35_318 [Bacteriovoracaceae bacterium]|nr:hypothetical protein [Bacteriovoracaceae bacterium]
MGLLSSHSTEASDVPSSHCIKIIKNVGGVELLKDTPLEPHSSHFVSHRSFEQGFEDLKRLAEKIQNMHELPLFYFHSQKLWVSIADIEPTISENSISHMTSIEILNELLSNQTASDLITVLHVPPKGGLGLTNMPKEASRFSFLPKNLYFDFVLNTPSEGDIRFLLGVLRTFEGTIDFGIITALGHNRIQISKPKGILLIEYLSDVRLRVLDKANLLLGERNELPSSVEFLKWSFKEINSRMGPNTKFFEFKPW